MGQATQDPRAVKAAQISNIKTPASLPTVASPDTSAPIQTPQFTAPNAYAYPAGTPPPMLAPGLFPTNSAPTQLDELTQAALGQSQFGQQEMAESLSRQRALANEAARLRSEQAAIAPHLAYHGWGGNVDAQHPVGHFFEPMHGVGSFFRNLGRGALAVGSATGPGQAIEGAIYSGPRQEYADVANRIREIQQASETERGTLEPEAQMGYHPMYSAVKGGTAAGEQVIQQRHWQNEDANAVGRLTEAHRHNVQTEAAELVRARAAGDRNAVMRSEQALQFSIAQMRDATQRYGIENHVYEGELNDYTKGQVANALIQGGMDKEHAWALAAGVGLPTTQIPLGPKPTRPTQQNGGGGKSKDKRGARPPGW